LLSYLPFRKQKLPASSVSQLKDLKWAVLGFSLITVVLIAWRRVSVRATDDPMGVRLSMSTVESFPVFVRMRETIRERRRPEKERLGEPTTICLNKWSRCFVLGVLGLPLFRRITSWDSLRLPALDGHVELQCACHCR